MSGFSVGAGYSAEAIAFFNRLVTAPTAARAKQYDILFRSLVGTGVWPLLDALWILAAADAATAVLNLKSTSHTLTAVNSPAFVADRGYTSDGSTSYLTGPNLATFGGQLTLNNTHVGVYVGTNVTGAGKYDCATSSIFINSRTGTETQTRCNDGTTATNAGPATLSSIGHTLVSRAASGSYTGYKNGTLYQTVNVTSTAIQSAVMTIGQAAAAYSTRQISACHVGGALTAAQIGAINAGLATYNQSVGAPTA